MSLAVDPTPHMVGQTINVTMTITNTGSTDVTGAIPTLEITSGSSLLDVQSGPIPAGPFLIPAGGSVTCTWLFTALSNGLVTCSLTFTGIDSGDGTTVSGNRVLELSIPSPLEASIAIDPAPPGGGQTFTVTLTITNTGSTNVTGIIPNLQIMSGSSLVSLQSGPTPAGPFSIPAGGSFSCWWTFIARVNGMLALQIKAFGIYPATGATVSTSASFWHAIWNAWMPPLKWSATYNSSTNKGDTAFDVAIDPAGNVLAAGFGTLYAGAPYNTSFDSWLVRKYARNGQLLWSVTVAGAGVSDLYMGHAQAVTTDAQGNVIAAGVRLEKSGAKHWAVQTYDPNGSVRWGHTSPAAQAFAVATDSSMNVVVAGAQGSGASTDWLIRKYNQAGTLLWERSYNGPANATDAANDVAIDHDGNIIVVGIQYTNGASEYDWVIRKYNGAGTLLWAKIYTGPGHWDLAYGVAVDQKNNIVVVGDEWTGSSPGQSYNWMIRKYDRDGNLVWSRSHNGAANLHDKAYTVVIDDCDNIVVGGYQDGGAPPPFEGGDWHVRQYDPEGKLLMNFSYSGPGNKPDNLYAMAIAGQGNLVLAGFETRADLGQGMNWLVRQHLIPYWDSCLIQVVFPPPAIPPEWLELIELLVGQVKIIGGQQGYINPNLGEQAKILVRPADPGEIRVRIYDEAGTLRKEITAPASGGRTEILHWDGTDSSGAPVPPGLYPTLIRAPGIVYRDKLVVIH